MYNAPFGKHLSELRVAPPRHSTTFENAERKENFTIECGIALLVSAVKRRIRSASERSRQKKVSRLMVRCENLVADVSKRDRLHQMSTVDRHAIE
jgi:hypothetical protein